MNGVREYKFLEGDAVDIRVNYADGPGTVTCFWSIKSALIVENDEKSYVVVCLNEPTGGCILSACEYEEDSTLREIVSRGWVIQRKHLVKGVRTGGFFDRLVLLGAANRPVMRRILQDHLCGGTKVDLARASFVCSIRDEYESLFHVDSIALLADAILQNIPALVAEKDLCDDFSWG